MEDARTAQRQKRRRRLVVALLLLVGLPLLLGGGAWLFLQSSAGEALIKEKVLAAVSDALAGKVQADGVELRGTHLVLTGVKLFTPEGELVASIERVEANVDLAGFAQQRVHLSQATLTTPVLLLKEDERGWNLVRAIAAKTPSAPAATPSAPNAWRVELDAVQLVDGRFDLQQADRRITATALQASGGAKVKLDPLEISGTLKLESQLTSPLQEKLLATLTADAANGPQSYDVAASLGETRLRGHVELPALKLNLDELVAAPRELTAFVPGWPLKLPVYGKGTLSLRQAVLQLSAGKAKVSLEAKYDLDASSAESLAVRGEGIDLKELLGAKQSSAIGFEATGALTDWRPATLGGAVKAKATWDAKGQRMASATLDATGKDGVANVSRLEVLAPGVSLTARGTASPEELKVFSTLRATDLRELDRALERFAGIDTGGLSGSGKVQVMLTGKPTSPAAKALGRLTSLSISGVQMQQLDLDVDVPDVTRPLDTDILLHARRLKLNGRAFDEVTFDFYTHGRELDLDLATKGLGDLKVHVIGVLDQDRRGADLKTAELTWTGATWSLEAPTRVVWGERIEVLPFTLHDGDRRVSGQLVKTRTTLDATVKAERLDLARLPKIISPPSWELGGTLDLLDVVVSGKPASPDVSATAKLHDGRIVGFTGLELALQGAWKNSRAQGTVSLGSDAGHLEGTFDVPVLALLDEKPGEGNAKFTLRDVTTVALEKYLPQPLPLQGTLGATLELSGSGEHPRLLAQVTSAALAPAGGEGKTLPALTNTTLTVFTGADGTLSASLDLEALGGHHLVQLATPLTLSSLRHDPPTKDSLLAMPVTLKLDLRAVELKQLAELAGVSDDELAGTASLAGTITGSVRAPTGELALDLAKLNYPPIHAADMHLVLRADAKQTKLTGTGSLSNKPAVELAATVAAPVERALTALLAPGGTADAAIDAVKHARLEALVVLQPFELGQAFPLAPGQTPPGGTVAATLEAGGTLEAPTARLFGTLANLRFDRVALGSARFDLKSTGTQQSFTVALGGQGRDDFKAKGTLGLDHRLSTLRHGLNWKAAPIDLSLDARNFDLGFLSGSTDLLRIVGGRLDLAGKVTGTLGSPGFVGDATLTQGRLALAGNGDYRDVELTLHATNDLVDVKKLQASSGAGKAELVARAERQPSGAFLLTSTGSAETFPLVNDDQLLATISLRYQLEGDVSSKLVDIRKLSLPRVDVRLPEVKRRDLQDLQRPKDIIVLRNGATATSRKKQAAKDASAPAEPGLVMSVVVDAPNNLWVRSSDLNVELGLSEGFRVELGDTLRLFGEARLKQGTINVIGREFTVQRGSEVRFGGPADQPYVNVSALHVNAREQVKITVTVAGKGTALGFKVASEPPMPESDIYAVLATGRRTLKNSGSASISPGQAASVVGQLAASQLKTVIAKKLPLDLFNFETSDDLQRVKFDIGWYLSDTLFLGGSVQVGAKRERGENVFSSRLEFQMTRSVTLEAYAGDALSFGADAVWTRDF